MAFSSLELARDFLETKIDVAKSELQNDVLFHALLEVGKKYSRSAMLTIFGAFSRSFKHA